MSLQDPDPSLMPWDRHPSIYEHIQSHVDPDRPGLRDGGSELPDEEPMSGKLRWAPGAMDGVFGHHMSAESEEAAIRNIVSLVLTYSRQPIAVHKLAVYRQVIEDRILSIIDPVLSALVEDPNLDHQRLYELAYSFATESPDREPVKFGIAILGLYRNPENESLFQTLGRHDEFTLYCAVALSNSDEDSEPLLWTLAQNVKGWGRIQTVERLSQTEDPRIKNWLVREGYRNSVMYEYLACLCARSGDLLSSLQSGPVDRELLTSTGEILEALLAGPGPAEGIDDYEDAAPVAELFLRHLQTSALTLDDFGVVHSLQRFLQEDSEDWETRAERGWTPPVRQRVQAACAEILGRPEWPERVRIGLTQEAHTQFYRARSAAKALGIDPWDAHWDRLLRNPTDSTTWYYTLELCTPERIDAVLEAASIWIDLRHIATGPKEELGMGPAFAQHSLLDSLLQELRRFPGRGGVFIQAGFQSPVTRNRNMAVNALAHWRPEQWTTELRTALQAAAAIEPVDDTRTRMNKVLKGEPLDD